jgi:hypothetical protein
MNRYARNDLCEKMTCLGPVPVVPGRETSPAQAHDWDHATTVPCELGGPV